MDRLRQIEVFIAVATAGGFASGGRRIGLSAPSVTRIITALEQRLAARLIVRTTRRLRLTEAGEALLDGARSVLEQLEEAELRAAGAGGRIAGSLAITGPVAFGRIHLTPVVAAFLDTHEGVTVRLTLLDRVLDLIEEGIDVGLRIGALADSTLLARRVGTVRRMLAASPSYLARRGVPSRVGDLAAHHLIAFSALPGSRIRGLPARLVVDDAAGAIAAAEAGQGIVSALSYQLAASLEAGLLAEILPGEREGVEAPVHLVHPAGRAVPARVRAFLDFAAPRLSARLALPARD